MFNKRVVEDYIFTIVAFIILMISIVLVSMIKYTMLNILSYVMLIMSLGVTIYGLYLINSKSV